MFVLEGLMQGLKAQDKKQYLEFITKSVLGTAEVFCFCTSNICHFFPNTKAIPLIFPEDGCKTVKAIRKTMLDSQTLKSFDEKNIFLANFRPKTNFLQNFPRSSELSPVLLKVEIPARWLQPVASTNHRIWSMELLFQFTYSSMAVPA